MSILESLRKQHRRCDELLARAEEAVRRGDWPPAADAFREFAAATMQHIELEENELFPAFERATGMCGGPTQMMCMEHREMRELIGDLERALGARDTGEFTGCCETLLLLLQQHNMKEENILYPMCDRALPQFAARL